MQSDRVLRREEIYERVWGYAMAHGDRSVDVFVRKLRQKLRVASAEWNYIRHALRGRVSASRRRSTRAGTRARDERKWIADVVGLAAGMLDEDAGLEPALTG